MEVDYDESKRRGRMMVLFGIVLAIATGAAAFFLMSRAQEQAGQAGLQRVAVVVAARDIAARKPIEAADVEVRDVPLDPTNERGVFADPQLVIGRFLAVNVLQGQLLTANVLASTATGGQFAIVDPTEAQTPESPAWRAVSLTVPDDRAVGGMLKQRETVDVFVTATVNVPQEMLESGRYYTDKATKIVYQDMTILARNGANYVLRADVRVAEEILHFQASGTVQFSLALRPSVDTRLVDASDLGATTNLLIERYGLPVPETYPAGRSGPAAITP